MTVDASPPDHEARQRIITDLDATLFVDAGAGAGKTSSLVGRIVALVVAGIDIDAIAAITFTEKAAAELRHRVRRQLQARADEPIVAIALERLDHAPIGTLHAFARRLLNEFPVQAGLPPGFTVLDELESDLAFEERWDELLDRLLADPEPPGGPIEGGSTFVQLCSFDNFGVRSGLRRVAVDFHDNWDLVAERVSLEPPAEWHPDLRDIVARAEALCATPCPDDDTQADCVAGVRAVLDGLVEATSLLDTLDRLQLLAKACRKGAKRGAKPNWKKSFGIDAMHALRGAHEALADAADAVLGESREYRKQLVGAILGRWVLDSADVRANDGTLEFHDLLVLARRLVRTDLSARRALHDRYRRLLLDEFQDTDPIQLSIAVHLASPPDDPGHAGDWTDLDPIRGRLFIVGDPKQSIYRFRRADIAQYLRAADQIDADIEHLTANFRSSAAVIDWVNSVFDTMIRFVTDAQPGYLPLRVCRPGSTEHGTVRVLGTGAHDDLAVRGGADELRTREAADVADAVGTALAEGWPVGPELRPCTPGDIAILLPARTSLPALEAALRERELPYRAENSSVVYTTTEIRHLMLALRAANDATDELALVAALRTPLYGCSDVELYEWKRDGGRWSIWSEPPERLHDHPVAQAIAHLRTVARRSTTMSPADLIAALVDERRLLDAALDHPDARDVWRRVRYVVEQARAWSDAGGHGLRRYLSWVKLQATESRAADTILPEHDHDAVRIMTIHAAKGLEFPITLVTGLTTLPRRAPGYSVAWPDRTWALATAKDTVYAEFQPLDELMSDAERRRLLYVATTRAVDHLVVSLHRLVRNVTDQGKMTSAELLVDCGAAEATPAVAFAGSAARYAAPPPQITELAWPDREAWAQARHDAVLTASRRGTVSATRLADDLASGRADLGAMADPGAATDSGLAKAPVDLDLPPWQRGRYGTAVGRAVHAVLQFADLATGADIDDLAAAQCAAEGVLGMDHTVASLARSALAAPIVRAALLVPHHRELYVAAEVGDRVLEGYIDLFVQTEGGGVIVDYKTDQWPDDHERAERIVRYRRQLAAYAVALEQIIDEPVIGGMLVRCRADGPAEQIELDGWPDAVAELRLALGQNGRRRPLSTTL